MKIVLLTIGTRGDIQPFVAMAKALQAAGHAVRLVAPENYRDWITGHDIPFASMGLDYQEFVQSAAIRRAFSGRWMAVRKIWHDDVLPIAEKTLAAVWDNAHDADVVIYHPMVLGVSDLIAATGAVAVCAPPTPLYATGDFPLLLFSGQFGAWINRLSYMLVHSWRLAFLPTLQRWRQETLKLPKGSWFMPFDGHSRRQKFLRLCAVSPSLLPKPKDWAEDIHITGDWRLLEAEDWQPDAALKDFLAKGDKPIYIGFGSMPILHPEVLLQTIISATQALGLRVILASGWSGLTYTPLPSHVFALRHAPHDQLFQYVRAAVHHGGVGTTSSSLRAGLPTLICPVCLDQPFWGKRVWKLGCGPRPLPLRGITTARLIERLQNLVTTEAYAQNAKRLAAQMQSEDGLATAVAHIEKEWAVSNPSG